MAEEYRVSQIFYDGNDEELSKYITVPSFTPTIDNNVITLAGGFTASTIYYLHLQTRNDPLEDHKFNIKLANNDNEDYQFLKSITVNKGEDNLSYIPIIVYGKSASSPNDSYEYLIQQQFLDEAGASVETPIGYFNSPRCDINGNIIEGATDGEYEVGFYDKYNTEGHEHEYRLFTPGLDTEIWIDESRVNRIISNESWKSSAGIVDVWVVFTPYQNFDKIVIEYVKGDNDIREPQNFSIKSFCLMNDLMASGSPIIIPHTPLVHLGVWADNNFLLSINGEEIAIGPRQYYEVEDFNITSLAVYPKDKADSSSNTTKPFTIDYQYIVKLEEQED